jgi:hypothetical protein
MASLTRSRSDPGYTSQLPLDALPVPVFGIPQDHARDDDILLRDGKQLSQLGTSFDGGGNEIYIVPPRPIACGTSRP